MTGRLAGQVAVVDIGREQGNRVAQSLGDDSAMVNGQVICVDGGNVMPA